MNVGLSCHYVLCDINCRQNNFLMKKLKVLRSENNFHFVCYCFVTRTDLNRMHFNYFQSTVCSCSVDVSRNVGNGNVVQIEWQFPFQWLKQKQWSTSECHSFALENF